MDLKIAVSDDVIFKQQKTEAGTQFPLLYLCIPSL